MVCGKVLHNIIIANLTLIRQQLREGRELQLGQWARTPARSYSEGAGQCRSTALSSAPGSRRLGASPAAERLRTPLRTPVTPMTGSVTVGLPLRHNASLGVPLAHTLLSLLRSELRTCGSPGNVAKRGIPKQGIIR